MSQPSLICPNDKCKGTQFSQVRGSTWQCDVCGTKVTLGKRKHFKKKISTKPKKTVPKKDYRPLTLKCEQCGSTIGELHHPKDESSFNKLWKAHTCPDRSDHYT